MNKSQKFRFLLSVFSLTLLLPVTSARASLSSQTPTPTTPIEHFVVLMQENHTFDNYFGTYPGAEGIPADACMPVDPNNSANTECIKPFHIGDASIQDLNHSLGTFEDQYNKGKMDSFVYAQRQRNQDGKLAMGYYDDRDIPYYWNLADEYVLFDHFFSSEHGGSFTNHMYWVAGQMGGRTPTEEGYGDIMTIFDRLEERGISWKFYIQNYDPQVTYRSPSTEWSSQVIWAPVLNIDRFIDDPKFSSHVVDLSEYYEDLNNGTLPAVAYIVPSGASEHPPGSIQAGQRFVKGLIQALMSSDAWKSSAFLFTYDDWGGWYDHVQPPQVDEYGYGFRVPALLVSAYAREGYIDSTVLDYTSILKFIEENWNLKPLTARDAKANNFMTVFDFSQPPRLPALVPFERVEEEKTIAGVKPGLVIYAAYGAAILFAFLILIRSNAVRHRGKTPTLSTHVQEDQS